MEAQFLFDNVSDPIVILDRNFRVHRANPSFWRISGFSPQQAVGRSSCDLFAELNYSQCNDACARVIERALQGSKVAVPNDHCPYFGCALPILDHKGKFDKTMLILKDLPFGGASGQASADLEQDKQREAAFAIICHDLVSPLQVIKTCTDVMRLELTDKSEVNVENMRQLIDATRRNERRLEEMIQTIRMIPRLEEGDYSSRAVQTYDVVVTVCRDFCLLLRDKETLQWDVSRNVPPVLIEPELLNRVLFNLLDNARRYISTGGRIKVSAQYEYGSSHVTFRVFDNGQAIPLEMQPYIFEKNFAVDSHGRGGTVRRDHGWGLYFCRLTMEKCGGSITVESKEGWGTQFSFTIPVAPSQISFLPNERVEQSIRAS